MTHTYLISVNYGIKCFMLGYSLQQSCIEFSVRTRDEKLDLHSVKCLVKGTIKTAFVTALHAFDARQILSLWLPLQGGLRW